MVRAAARWLAIAWVALMSALVLVGRELHPVVVGGYSKRDPRNPEQVRRRIARLEHQVFPGEQFSDHRGIGCITCDPAEREKHRWDAIPMPRATAWACDTCKKTGYRDVWRSHWVETGHTVWHEFDEWVDAYDWSRANGRRVGA